MRIALQPACKGFGELQANSSCWVMSQSLTLQQSYLCTSRLGIYIPDRVIAGCQLGQAIVFRTKYYSLFGAAALLVVAWLLGVLLSETW